MLTLSEQSCLEFWFGRTDFEELLSAFTLHFTRPFALTYEGARPPPSNARTFPIFIQFLSNNTKNNNQEKNSKRLTIGGSTTADFSVFPPGVGVYFLAKKDPPGVNSKVEGGGSF